MSTLKGLFFDLDGTLVNTYEADFMAYRDAIEEATGITIEHDAFMATNGMEMKKKLEILTPDITHDQVSQVAAGKKKYYKNYLHKTIPNESLIAFLKDMAEYHTTALVTTAKQQNAEAVLNEYGIANVFDVKIFGDGVSSPKPDPESYLKALEATGLLADEVLAFEDSQTGIDAAHAAGIKTVHIRSFS